MNFPFAPLFFGITKRRGYVLCQNCVTYFSTRSTVAKYFEKSAEIITGKHLLSANSKVRGFNFKITYVDECMAINKGVNSEPPVVLMLHGAPGSFHDYEPQIHFMLSQGTRVVVPSFPALSEMLAHRSPKFRNSPRNRAELVHDFLHFLGINRVDLLVAHSTSAYTAMCLQSDPERLSIRSLALLNPAGYQAGILSPWWLFKLLEELTYNRAAYAILRNIQPLLFKTIFKVGQYTDIEQPLSSVTSLTSRSPAEAQSMLQNLASSKLPLLVVFSENDRLFRAELSYELVEVLGGSKRNVCVYDEKGIVKSQGNDANNMSFISFKNGSHFAMKKYSGIVNLELLKLLIRRL